MSEDNISPETVVEFPLQPLVDGYLEDMEQAAVRGDVETAEGLYRMARKAVPASPAPLVAWSAVQSQHLHGPAAALRLARRAWEMGGGAPAMHAMALAHEQAKRLRQAEKCFRRALTLEPLSHHIWLNFGKMLHAQGRQVEAVAAFRAAQAANPSDNISTVFLAQALEALGERQVAFHILMSVMEKEPDGGYPMHVLGRVMSRGGHVKEGVELLARVAQVVPEMPAVQIDLGRALLEANRPFEAVERAEAAMKLAPAEGGPLALRARCHEEMGDADEARTMINRAVREHPDCPEVLREHAMLSFEHEDWAASLDSWSRLQRMAPENLEAVWGESFIRYIEGDKARFAKLAPLLRANRPELGAWWTSAPWPEERGKRISLARFFMRRLQDVGPEQTADAMPPVGEA